MNKEKCLECLADLIKNTNDLENRSCKSPQFLRWKRNVNLVIKKIFNDEEHLKEFNEINFAPINTSLFESMMSERRAMNNGLVTARGLLSSMYDVGKQLLG